MKKKNLIHKMIRILFILIIIAGIIVGVYLVSQKTSFFSKAGSDDNPRNIQITNISDTSFTVSWTTLKPAIGFVSLQEKTVNDDRDQNAPKARLTHHISLKHLNPSTKYSFKIGSGSKVSEEKEASTAPISANTPPLAQPIFGKVLKADKTPAADALVYVNIPGSTPLSSYTKDTGNFLVTLTNARTPDLTNYIEVQEGSSFDLTVEAGLDGNTKQSAKVNTRSALPDIILGSQSSGDLNGDGVVNSFDRITGKENQP